MNMSKLDITRDRSRHGGDNNRHDDTTFIRPATPLRVSNVDNNLQRHPIHPSRSSLASSSQSIRRLVKATL